MLSEYSLITGMNFKASFGIHTLRCAGWFNLPIPLRFAFGIGVSTIKKIWKGVGGILCIGLIC
jgi:hypothetical protein